MIEHIEMVPEELSEDDASSQIMCIDTESDDTSRAKRLTREHSKANVNTSDGQRLHICLQATRVGSESKRLAAALQALEALTHHFSKSDIKLHISGGFLQLGNQRRDLASSSQQTMSCTNSLTEEALPVARPGSISLFDISTKDQGSRLRIRCSIACSSPMRRFFLDLQAVEMEHLDVAQQNLNLSIFPLDPLTSKEPNPGSDYLGLARSVRRCLHFLDQMEFANGIASIRTNYSYFLLGVRFRAFENQLEVSQDSSLQGNMSSRFRVHRVLESLFQLPEFEDYLGDTHGENNPTRRNALVQRIQRGRKYVRIVEICSIAVLAAVPQLCVSRIDKLSFEALKLSSPDRESDSCQCVGVEDLLRIIHKRLDPLTAVVQQSLEKLQLL